VPGHPVLTYELLGIVAIQSRHYHGVLDRRFVAISHERHAAGKPDPVTHVVVVVDQGGVASGPRCK
jgi:hypothetical protein